MKGYSSDFKKKESDSRLDDIFNSCDADLDGHLDLSELKYAFQALGLYPTFPDEINIKMEELNFQFPMNNKEFKKIAESLMDSNWRKGLPTVPYARRGLSLAQLKAIEAGLLQNEWLQSLCDEFNEDHAEDIQSQKAFKMIPNLYSMDKSFVQATTHTDINKREQIPEEVLKTAGIPGVPKHNCCFAQLMNPKGLEVDYFVSHFWGHPFQRTVQALSNFAEEVYEDIGKSSPNEVVFWVCLFALNQHQAQDEVGSTPEEGPFNVALAKAKQGALMVLDGSAEPMRRIWCLYEISRAKKFGASFQLITDEGHLGKAGVKAIEDISENVLNLRAGKANASVKSDKIAIHWRILDPKLVNRITSFERFKQSYEDMDDSYYEEFDLHVCSLIGTPMLKAGMEAKSETVCMRAVGMGAEVTVADLKKLETRHDVNMKAKVITRVGKLGLVHVFVRSGQMNALKYALGKGAEIGETDENNSTPLHIAAYNGNVEICKVLIDYGAKVGDKTISGNTPLHWAAYKGNLELCILLVEGGAIVDDMNNFGWKPIHDANHCGHTEVVKFLRKHGE